MTIPVESSEVGVFTPDSLKYLGDAAPKFKFRAANERHLRRFRAVCADEGLESYSDEDFLEEKLRAIPLYWSEEDAAAMRVRLQTIVETVKQNVAMSDEDRAWAERLDEDLFDVHRPLRVMQRRTDEANEHRPRFSLATYLCGWSGIDVPFKLEAGYIPISTVDALSRELRKLGRQAMIDNPEGIASEVMPYFELFIESAKCITLTEGEEKNSPAPSPSTMTEDASTAAQMDGASIAERGEVKNDSSTSTQSAPTTRKSEPKPSDQASLLETQSDGQPTT